MGLIALCSDKRGYTFTEFCTNLFDGDVSVLHGVVKHSGGQQFLVGCHSGYDFHSLHWMDDIREPLAATLCPGMGANRKDDGTVQQCGV